MELEREQNSPFLDLKEDFIQGSKYLLHLPEVDNKKVLDIVNQHSLSMPVAQILCNRGYEAGDEINSFLFTSLEKDVPHSSLLNGAEVAVERILKAVKNKEKILIFGDYDVDGISSTSLILVSLLPLGADINFFLPNRARDGYGLSKKVVKQAAESGYKLIITVDNGISAFEPAEEAAKLGVDLIITDHHRAHGDLPVALAIVNPNQSNCNYPNKALAGVGVAFKLMSLLYERQKKSLPQKVYELLVLGTIADVVSLLGENRYWVRYGLSKINKQKSYAMSVLTKHGKITKARVSSTDIAFGVAPQLNALGRLSDPRDAVKFLISSSKNDVDRVGLVLFEMNEARKRVERQIYDDISQAVENKKIDLEKENIIIAAGSGWPSGVIGLVAGKLMHNYGRPALIFHIGKDGILKGSCRSIKEFNIFDALSENKDLLESFGGHSCAAGLSLKSENLRELKERLEEKIAAELTPLELTPKKEIDAILQLPDMGKKLLSDLEQLEPFGQDNPQPTFLVKDVTLLERPRLLKDQHVKCSIFSEGVIKPVIFFNRPELFSLLENVGEKSFHVAGSVTKNEWNGRVSVELLGADIVLEG